LSIQKRRRNKDAANEEISSKDDNSPDSDESNKESTSDCKDEFIIVSEEDPKTGIIERVVRWRI
jgi:hypothetical protein